MSEQSPQTGKGANGAFQLPLDLNPAGPNGQSDLQQDALSSERNADAAADSGGRQATRREPQSAAAKQIGRAHV